MSEVKVPKTNPPAWRRAVVLEPVKIPLAHYAKVGDIVLWYMGGHETHPPRPGMVLRADGERVDLNLFEAGCRDLVLMEGVFHADSKTLTPGQRDSAGTWRPRPEDLVFRKLAVDSGAMAFDGVTLTVVNKAAPPAA